MDKLELLLSDELKTTQILTEFVTDTEHFYADSKKVLIFTLEIK